MVLVCFDNGDIRFFDHTNSPLPEYRMNDLLMDRHDILWIGTETGLFSYNGGEWIQYTTENSGLCDDRVQCLAVASDNTLWIGTYNGVSRYTGEVITTSIDEDAKTPEALPVLHSYPNPFNPSTTIEFTLPESGFTALSIYNISGQKVRELAADYMTAGVHSLTWDGRDDSGNAVSSGIYITRLVAGKQVTAGRMLLLK